MRIVALSLLQLRSMSDIVYSPSFSKLATCGAPAEACLVDCEGSFFSHIHLWPVGSGKKIPCGLRGPRKKLSGSQNFIYPHIQLGLAAVGVDAGSIVAGYRDGAGAAGEEEVRWLLEGRGGGGSRSGASVCFLN